MFKNQLIQLGEMVKELTERIAETEEYLRVKKEELRDVKQAFASLERIQSKYDTEKDEEVVCEE